MRIAITDGLHPDAIAKLRAECGGEVAELEPTSLGSDGGNPITALIVRSRTKVTADVLASLPISRSSAVRVWGGQHRP